MQKTLLPALAILTSACEPELRPTKDLLYSTEVETRALDDDEAALLGSVLEEAAELTDEVRTRMEDNWPLVQAHLQDARANQRTIRPGEEVFTYPPEHVLEASGELLRAALEAHLTEDGLANPENTFAYAGCGDAEDPTCLIKFDYCGDVFQENHCEAWMDHGALSLEKRTEWAGHLPIVVQDDPAQLELIAEAAGKNGEENTNAYFSGQKDWCTYVANASVAAMATQGMEHSHGYRWMVDEGYTLPEMAWWDPAAHLSYQMHRACAERNGYEMQRLSTLERSRPF